MAQPLRRLEPSVIELKYGKATVTLVQTQNPTPSMADHSRGLEHHLLHHGFDAATFGGVAYRRIGLIEGVLPNQAQQVHRQRSELAHQIIVIELARGQSLQIHVGLELRVRLLMGGMVKIQFEDLSRIELLGQRARPAFHHVLGQQQNYTVLVNGAPGETIDTTCRVGLNSNIYQIQTLLPDALPLAGAMDRPLRVGVAGLLGCNRFDRRAPGIPLDDEGDLTLESTGLCGNFLHQLQRAKARIGALQQGRRNQTGGHRQGAFKVSSLSVAECFTPGCSANFRQ